MRGVFRAVFKCIARWAHEGILALQIREASPGASRPDHGLRPSFALLRLLVPRSLAHLPAGVACQLLDLFLVSWIVRPHETSDATELDQSLPGGKVIIEDPCLHSSILPDLQEPLDPMLLMALSHQARRHQDAMVKSSCLGALQYVV